MARPTKKGLDYFPLDVNFLKDLKVRKIKRACGTFTIEVLLCLLGNIYRENGYYIGWDEDTSFLVADEVGAKEGLVEEIVKKAVQVNFFDQEKFEKYKILTSEDIQNTYLEATKKRKEIVIDDIYRVNDTLKYTKTIVNDVNNQQSKVNKSKVNKSKVNKSKVNKSNKTDQKKSIFIFWEDNGFGTLASKTVQDFEYWINDFVALGATKENAVELIVKSLEIAVDRNVRNYSYVNAILKDWEQKRYLTVRDVLANQTKTKADKKIIRKEKLPDWVNNPVQEETPISKAEQEELERQIAEFTGAKND